VQKKARDLILAICAAPDHEYGAQICCLTESDWQQLAVYASRTRTFALVARAIASASLAKDITHPIAQEIQASAQDGALAALMQGHAAAKTIAMLGEQGFRPIALKGLSLAFRDYPDPSLRPMRDLDLLLQPEDALAAQQFLLQHADFKQRSGVAIYGLDYGHQLPEIEHVESGLIIELHHRINARDWGKEPLLLAKLHGEALQFELLGQSVTIPSAEANFLHLVEHSTLHHLFANGPLILSDLHYIAAGHSLDWDRLYSQAEELGLARSLTLLSDIAASHGADWASASRGKDALHYPDQIEEACNAMFDSAETNLKLAMIGRLSDHAQQRIGVIGALGRMVQPSANQLSRLSGFGSDSALRWLGYPAWLLEKGRRYLGIRTDAGIADQAVARAKLGEWLKGM
jgi:hypothetical protein